MSAIDDEYLKKYGGAAATASPTPAAPTTTGSSIDDEYLAKYKDGGPLGAKPHEREYEREWYDRPRAALQGLTLGGEDELGSLVTAAAIKGGDALGLTDLAEGKSFGDVYTDVNASLEDERHAYEDAHSGEALAYNLAGGLATGGLGAGRALGSSTLKYAPKMLVRALEASPTVAKLTTKAPVLEKAIKAIPTTAKALSVPATGAAFGTAAGALSADQGYRVEGAETGGTLGAALPMLPLAAKNTLAAASKSRLAQSLIGPDGRFLPLNLVHRGGLGDFYRHIVGKSFGGHEKLIDQARTWINEAERKAARAAEKMQLAKAAKKDTVSRAKRSLDREFNAKAAQAEQVAADSVEAARGAMRKELLNNALPTNMPAKEAERIRGLPMPEANAAVKAFWSKHGFKSLEGKFITTTPAKIKAALHKALGSDPAMKQAGKGFEGVVDAIFEKFSSKGAISAKALNELKNALRGNAVNNEALAKAAKGKMRDKITEIIRGSMKGKELEQFDDDLARWGAKRRLNDSVIDAQGVNQGLPFEKNVINAAKKAPGDQYALGQASGQAAAQRVQQVEKQAAKGLAKTKAKLAAARDAKKAGTARLGNSKVAAAKDAHSAASSAHREVRAMAPDPNLSLMQRLAATGALGQGFNVVDLASGTMLSRILGSQTAQKALVGQTNTQKYIADLLRRKNSGINALSAGLGAAEATQADK